MNNYSSHKETNIPWIGDIPTGWSTKPLKHILSEKKSTKNPDVSSGSISFGKVIYKDDEKIPVSTKESYQEVLYGEFLINPLNLNYDLKSLRIGLSRINVVVSQGYIVLRINDGFIPEYYEYLLRKFDVEHMKSLGQGVRQTISFTHIKDEKLVVPPLKEQKLISRYLDKKTEQIDQLVEKTQKKIELLKEQRTSLINQSVTKGLDPNVEMKDSGVEWIGEVPKHWKISKVKFELNLYNNIRIPLSAEERGNRQGEYPYYGSTSLIDWVDDYLFDGRYILIAEDGGNLVLRNLRLSFIVEGKFWVNNHAHILKSKCEVYDHYYCEFLEQSDFTTSISGSAQPKLTLEAIKEIPVCVPSENEIDGITSELKKVVGNFRKLLEVHNKKIDTLKEYRQSLISSVVTGKVRVTEDMV